MARILNNDLRIRVLNASAAGMPVRQAAGRFSVGGSTAIRWIARKRASGHHGHRVGDASPFWTHERRLASLA